MPTPSATPSIRSPGVMDTPNRSTNSNGVSYDWESNSESDSGPSREYSNSNTFGAQTARYEILSSGYNLMSFYASHGQDSFQDVREAEYEMASWMRKRWERKNNKDNKTDIDEASNGQLLFGVGDPLVHITIMSTKRKNLDSASSPCLRRSKGLAALSMDQFTDGRDDDEMNVPSGGDNEEMSTSFSHADNDSDGENYGENDGQSESDDESDGESESEGAIKLPNLSNFVSRPFVNGFSGEGMEIELGHNSFCEITRVEMVLTADGGGVVQMVAVSAWMVMAVRRLYCGNDPIAAVLGKIEGLRRESVVCWERLTG
ncbi:hypothetical protein RHGRI_025601 [Rhododendron griersonianum]|uniref:Uncharacterized protein n=1 Tax=Rhododendron griersonianum TaxID=479676 RepID=A0AAV6IVU5_9ERIC|nr:hypothetical protein RHGRI_025601 [Rhododendron griersonianum]